MEQNNKKWHVERRINLGDIFTMLGMFLGILAFVGTGWLYLYKRVDVNTTDIILIKYEQATIREEMRRDRQDIKDDLDEIKQGLRDVSKKLDQKADKQ